MGGAFDLTVARRAQAGHRGWGEQERDVTDEGLFVSLESPPVKLHASDLFRLSGNSLSWGDHRDAQGNLSETRLSHFPALVR